MPDQTDEAVELLNSQISAELKKTFDTVAKTAMDGSLELQDASLTPVDKMRKAHSQVTLIIDDAMRGLADAHDIMFDKGISPGLDIGLAISAAGEKEQNSE